MHENFLSFCMIFPLAVLIWYIFIPLELVYKNDNQTKFILHRTFSLNIHDQLQIRIMIINIIIMVRSA